MDHMNHDMASMASMTSTMTMAMSATSTASAAMSTGSSHSMDMGGMGGMHSMDGMGSSSCKISMLWNWYTIDSCFLSSQWHITSRGMFAGSCIGVICLVICLEFLRRVGREYDAFIVRRARLRNQYTSATSSAQRLAPASDTDADINAQNSPEFTGAAPKGAAQTTCSAFEDKTPVRPTLIEQLVRALLHMLQFAVAYFVMLLAMYFNGYIIICIFIGAFLGSFIFSWEPLNLLKEYVVHLTLPSPFLYVLG
ncbi:hypothetical protein CNMCM6106_001300 [Aspergillus hiratsukae]|uniref:Copper transport protein n=1 Tax=Aspergillus hiratsukae TaxID=1194566 RepID=A0A8H6Q2R5_9EURO|nr:hypothetical protein CNMCM6106_001300 [Aspergillus hiratsukae]